MPSLPSLLESPFSQPGVGALFADEQFVPKLVEFEAALARAEASLGVIPAEAGEAIDAACRAFVPDLARLRQALERDGVPVAGLVQQLRQAVGAEFGSFVHFGATTQDVMDTAFVLQIRAALALLEADLEATITNLARLADQHRETIMAGRTHGQQAVPITFGLKAAGWLAPLLRHRRRLAELSRRVFVVQIGGAAGTLAPLGGRGIEVQEALARELDLGVLAMPWHTQRDALAELAGWLSLVSASLAKMAQDVLLLTQTEVAEVQEDADPSRGGSSTMPQKRNPVASEHIVGCARLNASLLSSMHQAAVQEHERGTHGWQVEWLALPRMLELTGAALHKSARLSASLQVDEGRLRRNVAASQGLLLAEALSFALAPSLGREAAKRLVGEATKIAAAEGRHLVDVVRESSGADLDWETLKDPGASLGASQAFIDRVLREASG